MKQAVSHDQEAHSIEAKARWYQSLSLAERMDVLCEYTDLILSVNPGIVKASIAEQARKGARILSHDKS